HPGGPECGSEGPGVAVAETVGGFVYGEVQVWTTVGGGSMSAETLVVRPLVAETWPAFAELVEANNGVWGGCWCVGFHLKLKGRTPAENRAEKEARVRDGRTHAALVFDGDKCLGWCQFGSPDELPEIKSKRLYDKGLEALPDWRITCFFTGKGLRG